MMTNVHYIAKSICSAIQMITVRCLNHLAWPQVCKIKPLGVQTVLTNTCERTSRCQALSEFQRNLHRTPPVRQIKS